MQQHLILVGFMGCGKSALARALAKHLNCNYIDTDELIVKQTQLTIPELFDQYGEAHFRQLESLAIDQLHKYPLSVIATGGGLPCFANHMEKLNLLGCTVYLQASADLLCAKLQSSNNPRPLLAGKNSDELLKYVTDCLKKREQYYQQAQLYYPAHSNVPYLMASHLLDLLDLKFNKDKTN